MRVTTRRRLIHPGVLEASSGRSGEVGYIGEARTSAGLLPAPSTFRAITHCGAGDERHQ